MYARAITLGVVVVALLLPASAAADFAHVVEPGETLTSVAAADGLSVAALATANGISPNAELTAGTVIQIPPQTEDTMASTTSTTSTAAATTDTGSTATSDSAGSGSEEPTTVAGCVSYVIQPGDTLSAIAARAGTTASALASLNGMGTNDTIYVGHTLQLPAGTSSGSTTHYVSATASDTTGSQDTTSSPPQTTGAGSGNPPYPTDERVDSAEIAQVAAEYGVPASLAEAIGWQESGWNNAEVSGAGAVGVMQIVPDTWSWINQNLTPSDPLAPASADENVRGGVLLIRDLLQMTGGSYSLTAAGYYQGLASVRKYGMYDSTKQYVADVLALQEKFAG